MASDPTETRMVSILDTSDWAALNAGDYQPDGFMELPSGRILSGDNARAVLAYRDRVAASLSDEQVRMVLDNDLRMDDNFEWLRDQCIVDEHCELTDFGDEIARVLRENR